MDNQKFNTQIIREYRDLIIKYNNQENIKLLKETSYEEYKFHMYNKFSEFRLQYPFIFDKIISNDNIEMLDTMLNSLDHLDNSKDFMTDLNKIRFALGNKLHDTYINDKINYNNINLRKTNKNTQKYLNDKKNKYKKNDDNIKKE